jgi:vancomycin resistance protein YoaR
MSDTIRNRARDKASPATGTTRSLEARASADAIAFRRSRASGARARLGVEPDRRTILIAAAVAVGVLLFMVLGDAALSWGRIHPGVRIGDVSVGSMAPGQAHAVLSDAFAKGSATPITVAFEKTSWKVTRAGLGAKLDATASVAAAMAVGRSKGAWAMIADRFAAVFGGVNVTPTVAVDDAKVDALLDRISATVSQPSRDASVSIVGVTPLFVTSEVGRAVDRDATREAILDAFFETDRTTAVVAVPARPQVADADARQAFLDSEKLLAGPVTLTYGARSLNVSRETVATWVRFERRATETPAVELSQPSSDGTDTSGQTATSSAAPQRMMLVASFDPAKIGKAIASLTKGLGSPARNASFTVSRGKVKVIPSRVGRGPDLTSLAGDLARACVGTGARKAVLRLGLTQPKLTTAAAREMGISDRISSFTTTYSTVDPARTNNVHTLAKAFDAKLVPPGGVFSFNGTAGERTAAKGYEEAPAIVKGKLVPQLGGGVCQVGTTFFNAVFFSGLPVVERHNHSFYISHYPKGRDATVSWGGPDFKFKNDTKGWILIRTATTASSLTISLYGTDPGYDVQYTTGPFTDVVKRNVVEKKDPKLKKGARIVEDTGVDGCRIVVVRTVYKGGEVVRTDRFVSIYSAKDEIVRVGTKESSKSTTTTPSP